MKQIDVELSEVKDAYSARQLTQAGVMVRLGEILGNVREERDLALTTIGALMGGSAQDALDIIRQTKAEVEREAKRGQNNH